MLLQTPELRPQRRYHAPAAQPAARCQVQPCPLHSSGLGVPRCWWGSCRAESIRKQGAPQEDAQHPRSAAAAHEDGVRGTAGSVQGSGMAPLPSWGARDGASSPPGISTACSQAAWLHVGDLLGLAGLAQPIQPLDDAGVALHH